MRLITLLILLTIGGFAYSQDPVISLDVTTKDDDTGKKLSGSTVEVYKDGSLFITKKSASNGRVPPIDLPLGANYKIVIKKEGYVAKVATLSGYFDYPEDLPPFVPFPIQTSLFKKVEGVDFAWLETTPMIKFELDQYGNQTWDKSYTKDMLAKIEKLKKELAEKAEEEAKKKEDFDAYVKTGNNALGKEDYQTAIDNYDKALELFDDAEVKKNRDKAQKALDDKNANEAIEKKFQELMSKAKDQYSAKNYKEALATYKEASGVKPTEQLPKDRIAEIEKLLADEASKEADFKKFVDAGDKAMTTEAFDDAISNYENALKVKDDSGVKAKLEDAKKKKADKEAADAAAKENEQKYNDLMADADKAFDSKSYEDAKSKYEEALKIKPGESKPAARISEIDAILKKQKEEADALERMNEQFNKLVEEGDAAFDEGKWQEAIDTYNEALKLKPIEKHPKDQIELAKKKLEEEKANSAKEEEYKKLMADANSFKDAKKYEEAIAKYKEAQTVKPSEKEPADKIAEVQKLMEDLANAEAKEAEYQKYMADGTAAQGSDDLNGALEQFKKAIGVKPGDATAQKKIDEINKLIADKEAAEAKEKEFNDLVAKAEKSFNDKSYTDAKMNYQKALDIKADADIEAKIKEIEALIAANQNAEQQQKKYDAAMKEANDAFAADEYEKALAKYEEAYATKEEADAKNGIDKSKAKIAELKGAEELEQKIKDFIAAGDDAAGKDEYDKAIKNYSEAIKLRPDPSLSKKILDLEQKKKEAIENDAVLGQYLAKIKEADEAFNSSSWESAKSLYKEAIDIKGDEQYPKDQLDEIDRKMKEESENEIEKQYQKILSVAQTKMDAEDYDKAIELYNRAKDMKPSDPLPQEQIDKINAIKAAKEKELADKEAFEKKYKDLIAKADKGFDAKEYEAALKDYKEAINMKPNESHPKSRITEIEGLLAQNNAVDETEEKYLAAIKKADGLFDDGSYQEAKDAYLKALDIKSTEQHPKDRIDACDAKLQEQAGNEIEKQYQKILTVAQKKFTEEDYTKALELYTRAKDMKPSDPLPQQRIDEINQLLKDMADDAAKRAKYKKLLAEADNLYESKKFKDALTKYQDALDVINTEQYPKDQVEKCREAMKQTGGGNAQYDKLIKKADEYFNEPNYTKAKSLYQRAVKLKPSDQYPKDQLKAIDKILNPPKVLTAESGPLKDYGPAINETPIDIEAMLREAEEEARYYEYQQIFDKREEADAANAEWAGDGYDLGFKTREESEQLQLSFERSGERGEAGRVISREEVVVMENDFADYRSEYVVTQDNDIQYQNKRIEAMTQEIIDNEMGDDKPREEYLLDVEIIKDAVNEKTESDVNDQVNVNQNDKVGIEDVKDEHVTRDPNNDVNRLNVLVEVEDFKIVNLNEANENVWDQEDENQKTKNDTEYLRDDIYANSIDNDVNREESLEVIEGITISYSDREGKNSDTQLNNNMTTKNNTEDLKQDIIDNQLGNDIPRQEMELIVEEKQLEFANVEGDLKNDQTNVIMNADATIEELEIKREEDFNAKEKQREGYEEVVVEITDDIIAQDSKLSQENEDNGIAMKDVTEDMQTDITKKNNEGADKSIKNADAADDAIENYKEHISDDKKENEESLNNSVDYAESLKDIDVKKITPEVENELGKKFPAGVTEESFAINDANGLMKAFVVRRIVVINGAGKVYEKTSTRYGHVSYTRNGEPISEYQWNDETSSAQVGRN
ncbi:MAG: hypothetical protein ABJG68_17080 [Crocinitomicaceae bacterium]